MATEKNIPFKNDCVTVSDLIAELTAYDPQAEVWVAVTADGGWGPAEVIRSDDRGMIVIQTAIS